MGKYASETGTSAAVRKFRPDFPKIKESTIREFKKKYEEELKLAKQQNREVRTELSTEKQGRPLFLGTKIDTLVQRYIRAASNRGAIITRSIVKSVAKALLIRYPNEIGKINLDDSGYGKSLLQRMNYTRRKAATSKVKLPDGIRKESELLFHHQIVEKIEKYDIPDSLIVNFDQTPSKYVPVALTILQAIRTGSANLERLDPFSDIDPLLLEVTHENNINRVEINDEEREVFINPARDYYPESDSDSDDDAYAPEDDHRNVFDIFEDNEL